jgi:uncharacterized protein
MRHFSCFLYLVLLFFISINATISFAKEVPVKGKIQVYDFAGVLSPEEHQFIQKTLKDWKDSTSIEMAVVIDASLEEEDIFDYSLKIARSWGIGDKSTNNGILLYISKGDKRILIHIGPGLQEVIPDALSKRIIENQIKPAFREQQYGKGIISAILTFQQLAAGTYQGDSNNHNGPPFGLFFILFLILFVIVVFFLYRSAGRSHTYSRSGDYSSGGGMWFFPGGFGSGGGYDGDDSGGFDFGGGDFDGGGAGGDW